MLIPLQTLLHLNLVGVTYLNKWRDEKVIFVFCFCFLDFKLWY